MSHNPLAPSRCGDRFIREKHTIAYWLLCMPSHSFLKNEALPCFFCCWRMRIMIRFLSETTPIPDLSKHHETSLRYRRWGRGPFAFNDFGGKVTESCTCGPGVHPSNPNWWFGAGCPSKILQCEMKTQMNFCHSAKCQVPLRMAGKSMSNARIFFALGVGMLWACGGQFKNYPANDNPN